MSDSCISQIYQLQMELSTGNFRLPTITQISRDLGVSRQMIYKWANGESRSRKVSQSLTWLTGVTFPDKLVGPIIIATKTLFRIR